MYHYHVRLLAAVTRALLCINARSLTIIIMTWRTCTCKKCQQVDKEEEEEAKEGDEEAKEGDEEGSNNQLSTGREDTVCMHIKSIRW